jgi:hypothetical protein
MIITVRLALLLTLLAAPQAGCSGSAKADPPVRHEVIALADMRQFAQQHLGTDRELPQTFRIVDDWSATYVLSWADFHTGHETVRVYHATGKHGPSRRFVLLGDGHHGRHHHWQPVH